MLGDILTAEAKGAVESIGGFAAFIVSLIAIYGFIYSRNKKRFDRKADKSDVKAQIDLILKDIDNMKKEISNFKDDNFQSHVDMRSKIDENKEDEKERNHELKSDLKESMRMMQEAICQHLTTLSDNVKDLRARVA